MTDNRSSAGTIEAALRDAFPHFQDGAPITPEAIRAIGKEHLEMVMGWEPQRTEIEFSDHDGKLHKIVFEPGDYEAGIGDGWVLADDSDLRVPAQQPLLSQVEAEARRYAGMYPEASDGRNTFVLFADYVARLAAQPPAAPALTPLAEQSRQQLNEWIEERRRPPDAPVKVNAASIQRRERIQAALDAGAPVSPSSAATGDAIEELAEFLCDEYEGEIGSFCSFNIEIKNRWRDLVRAMLARVPAQPQSSPDPTLEETARFLLDRLDEFDPGEDEPEREYHGHVAPAIARLRSALSRPHGAVAAGAFYKTRGDKNNLPHIVGPLEHADDGDAPWQARVYDQVWKWGYDGLANADGSPHNRDLVERVYRPAPVLNEPPAVPMPSKLRPADCIDPMGCGWRHIPTTPEIGLYLCGRFGCPHTTSSGGGK